SIAAAGDVDGDGVPDILVGAPATVTSGVYDSGAAYLYSGSSGLLLRRIEGLLGGQHGTSVGSVGDIDGDGRADFAVSGDAVRDSTGTTAGSVYVYSGATGSLLFNLFGTDNNEGFGSAIASLGNVDGDGVPDILVGASGGVCGSGVGSAYT